MRRNAEVIFILLLLPGCFWHWARGCERRAAILSCRIQLELSTLHPTRLLGLVISRLPVASLAGVDRGTLTPPQLLVEVTGQKSCGTMNNSTTRRDATKTCTSYG